MKNPLGTIEAAKRLGLSRQRVSQMLNRGELNGVRVGGRWIVDSKSVQAQEQKRSNRP